MGNGMDMGMNLVGLLRHGEVEGGACFRGSTDDPLTPKGWSQMWKSVNRHPPWQRIISSPLIRCADFAQGLARHSSIPLVLDERLREIDFGTWEGRTASALMAEEPDELKQFWNNPLEQTPPGGEPLTHFQERVLNAWQETTRLHPRQRTLWVAHGGVIRIILCKIQQRPVAQLMQIEVGHAALYQARISGEDETGVAEIIEEG